MKHIVKWTIFIVFVIVSIRFVAIESGPEKVFVKTLKGKRFQLIVDEEPFMIKGVVYNPVPIGETHTYDFWSDRRRPHLHDARLMKTIGVNTIRVYQPGKSARDTKRAIRDLYNRFKIRVAMGHWLGFWDNPNYARASFRKKIKKDVIKMVKTYKNEKGILCWILGNENNFSFYDGAKSVNLWTTKKIDKIKDPLLRREVRAKIYYTFINDLARAIKRVDPNHPVVLANADLDDIDVAGELTPEIDILGCSVYRGKTLGSFFRAAKGIFQKPVFLTEFGCDRYNAHLEEEDESMQSEFIEAQWKEIEKNSFKGNGTGNSIGGFVFEWTDEWWKFHEDNKSGLKIHDTLPSWSNGAYYFDIKAPKNLNINEEWWGINALRKTKQGLDERVPKKAYFTLKKMWR